MFDKPDEDRTATFALSLEGKNLWIHREYLAQFSPKLKHLLLEEMKEQKKVKLPNKLNDMRELLQCLYPPFKPIDGKPIFFDLRAKNLLWQISKKYNNLIYLTHRINENISYYEATKDHINCNHCSLVGTLQKKASSVSAFKIKSPLNSKNATKILVC